MQYGDDVQGVPSKQGEWVGTRVTGRWLRYAASDAHKAAEDVDLQLSFQRGG